MLARISESLHALSSGLFDEISSHVKREVLGEVEHLLRARQRGLTNAEPPFWLVKGPFPLDHRVIPFRDVIVRIPEGRDEPLQVTPSTPMLFTLTCVECDYDPSNTHLSPNPSNWEWLMRGIRCSAS
jgi:hypothetical protein